MSDDLRQIVRRSIWRYIGPVPGRGELHAVVDPDPAGVVTISADRIWLGTAAEFLDQFRLVQEAPGTDLAAA